MSLNTYLSSKLFIDKDNLQQDCYNALEDIFLSCYMANQKDNPLENIDLEDTIALQFSQILKQVEENMQQILREKGFLHVSTLWHCVVSLEVMGRSTKS